MKYLLTGATGLIGSHLLKQFQAEDTVYALSRSCPRCENSPASIQHLALDLAEAWERSSLPDSVDAIIHLAQSEHYREFPEKAEDVFMVNTVSTVHLLEYARTSGVKKFIYASSGGVYGAGSKGFTEQECLSPTDDLGFYLGTKVCSEISAQCYEGFFDVSLLRFFFVYGPGQRQSALVPRLVDNIKNGRPIRLHGENGIQLTPTYVSDATIAIMKSLSLSGLHRINVAGPEILTLREIGDAISQELNVNPVFEVDEGVVPEGFMGDINRMEDLLGSPVVIFKDGIQRVCASIDVE